MSDDSSILKFDSSGRPLVDYRDLLKLPIDTLRKLQPRLLYVKHPEVTVLIKRLGTWGYAPGTYMLQARPNYDFSNTWYMLFNDSPYRADVGWSALREAVLQHLVEADMGIRPYHSRLAL